MGMLLGTRNVLLQLGGAGGLLWTPLNLGAKLVGLWDARQLATLYQESNGTTPVTAVDQGVAYIGDGSGAGNHLTQATGTMEPLYKPTAINGAAALSFDGTDDHLEINAALETAYPYVVFGVFKTSSAGPGALWWIGDKDVGAGWEGLRIFTGGVLRLTTNGSTNTDSVATYTDGAPHYYVARMTGAANKVVRVDGTEVINQTASEAFPAGTDRFSVGRLADSTPAHYWPGHIALTGFVNSSITDTELSNLEAWLAIASLPAGVFITLAGPAQYQTYQRDGSDQAGIPISGTFGGTPTAIEARFNGGSWATIDASPSGGAFSGTLSAQAAGQGTLEVRFTNLTGVIDSVADVGIGDVFVVAGQSNAEGRATNAQSYSHATLKATVFRQDDTWRNGNDPTDTATANGSPWPLLATLLMAVTGFPVAFITTATGATGLYAATWTKNGTEYADCIQTIANSDVNNVKAVLWHQGENDANDGVTAIQYETALGTFLNDLQADSGFSGMKLVCANLGYKTTGGVTRANLDAIRKGQLDAVANDADILPGPVLYDVDLSAGDGVHFKTDVDALKLAQRWWRTLHANFFSGAEPARGPQLVSATRTGAVVTVTFTGGQGNLAGQTNTTGWRVTDNGTPIAVSSAAANGTNAVDLTLASTPAGIDLVSFGSFNDAAGGTLKDSGTYAMPPEPFVDAAIA